MMDASLQRTAALITSLGGTMEALLSQWIALGDYYLMDVVLGNKDDQMEMSDVHRNYFAVMGQLGENTSDHMEEVNFR